MTYEAIAIDSRMLWRVQTPTGYSWKTFDIFTQGTIRFGAWNHYRYPVTRSN